MGIEATVHDDVVEPDTAHPGINVSVFSQNLCQRFCTCHITIEWEWGNI